MKFMSFRDWALQKESSAFTRSRDAAASGTGVKIPGASLNSRSTGTGKEKSVDNEEEDKKDKKDKKDKRKKKDD